MMKYLAGVVTALGMMTLCVAPLALATDIVDCTDLPEDQCALITNNQLDYTSSNNVIWKVVQFLFVALGGIAVIMIIVGGIQYATSQGESGTLQKAKNTILYAVIGLVVAMVATGIVTFIIDNVAR